jgi:hypothetical protein
MSDDQDLIRSMTDGATTETRAAVPCIVVPGHAINSIEMELLEQMHGEISDIGLPPIFVDPETGELETRGNNEPWTEFFDGRIPAPWEAYELAAELVGIVEQKFAQRIAIARECEKDATRQQYIQACKREGIEP